MNAPNLRVLDLENNEINGSVGSSIGSFNSQDYMAIDGNSAYIFMGDKLGVIDTDLDSAFSEILLADAEASSVGMLIEGNKLYVLTNSGWATEETAHIYKIDLGTQTVDLSIDLSTLGLARLLQSDGNDLYFMVGADVYKMGLDELILVYELIASFSCVIKSSCNLN